MERQETTKSQLEILKGRIPYNVALFQTEEIYEQVLNNLLEDSMFICLSLRFPFDDTQEELPNTPKYKNWQIRCAVEIYNSLKNKTANFLKYSENGISWTRESSILSINLKNEIMPKVGIPKKEVEKDE